MWELTRASKNGKKTSAGVLRRMLTTSKDTVYGKEHNFEEILKAGTEEELFSRYQKNVKINEYEDLRPYVERQKSGEPDILFPGKPMMYATTSGTTKEPKWIPVSWEYYKKVYKKINPMWYYAMLINKPKTFWGVCVSIVGKAIEGAAPDGTVYGSISGVMQRDAPSFLKSLKSEPPDVFNIPDYKARYYAIMRIGVEQDAHLFVTANPSTFLEMQSNVNEFYDDYCDDIEHGTISEKLQIPDDIRAVLRAYVKPNPVRAAELRELKKQYGTVLPKHYWPHMQVVNTWFCGNAKVYFDKIKDFFPPDCAFLEIGYVSSECRSGIVFKASNPETTVFCHKSYFEFIHESDLENTNPRIYQIYELKKGERYCMLVTTCSGLYRYNMNDLLEITGYYNEFPLIKFIQKVNGIVSLTGEKLHERQFIEAVHETEKKTGKMTRFFVGFANTEKSNYNFYYEFADQGVSVAEAEKFTALLDDCLKGYNPEYRDKRDSNRVKPPETALLGPDSFEKFKAACLDQGYREGQFKINLLMQNEMRHAMFKELVK
jgi:hypothetical protein